MSTPKVSQIVTTVTKRAWHDIEPKVLTFFATGLSADLVIRAADYVGFHVDPGLAMVISTVLATVAGYVKSSTSKTEIPAATVIPVAAPVEAAPVVVDSSAPVA